MAIDWGISVAVKDICTQADEMALLAKVITACREAKTSSGEVTPTFASGSFSDGGTYSVEVQVGASGTLEFGVRIICDSAVISDAARNALTRKILQAANELSTSTATTHNLTYVSGGTWNVTFTIT